jgi:inner membrane protease ATP23
VKRRAAISIAMNPACAENAEAIVDEVFETCFKDTTPFEDIY